jgi:hypothetical protein
MALGAVIFIPTCLVLMFFINAWFAAVLALLPALWFYYVWECRVIVITCPSCGKDINTNTPWECGFKGCRNEDVDNFPFIHECKVCQYIPKAYVCHHHDCQRLIYLTSDRQQIHAAKRLEPGPPPKDVIGEKIATQKEEVRDLEHLLQKTKIVKDIEIIKSKPVVPPPLRTEVQYMLERVRRGVENMESLNDQERELLEEMREKHRNNPEALAQAELDLKEVIFKERERMSGGH